MSSDVFYPVFSSHIANPSEPILRLKCNRTTVCRYESAKLDTGVTQRPVIRLPGGIVLTRIDPSQKDTSMIMRIRPGWDALRAFLAPDPKGK